MTRLSESLSLLKPDYKRLSRRSGIEEQRLLDLSAGSVPTIAELKAISDALKLSIPSLLEATERIGIADLRFRKSRSSSLSAAEVRIFSVINCIQRHVSNVPSRKIPSLTASLNDGRTIELAALALREKLVTDELLLDPIPNLAIALDEAEIAHVIRLKNLPVHGAAMRLDETAFVFVASQFPPRSLFSLAHEIGHLVFGHLPPGGTIIDADTIGSFKDGNDEERLCDCFAAALLIPAESLVRFLRIIRSRYGLDRKSISSTEVMHVSSYFGTSFLVAAFRFEQLELLPPGGAIALQREVSKQHGTPEKLAALGGIPKRNEIEIPVVSEKLKNKLVQAIEDGNLSIGFLADSFGLSVSEMQYAIT